MEANLKSRHLHKVQLYLLKVMPMVMAFCYIINSVLSYFDIDLLFLSYLGGCSFLMLIFLYLASYSFNFCRCHRMFLHYITLNTLLNLYDSYVGLPLEDRELLILYISIAGIMLFLLLYIHVKHHKRSSVKSNR